MKKLLCLLLLFNFFVLGCDNLTDEIDEVSFDEVFSEEIKYASELGMKQYEAGNFKEALKTYTKAIESNSDYAGLYADRGRVKREIGDLDGAIEDENKALELSNEAWLYAERAVTYQVKGEKALALQDYKRALSINPDMDWVKRSIKELESE